MVDIKSVGKTVELHRKHAALSRNRLAELSGVGKTAIYDIEHGKNGIKLQTLLKIFKVLNINIELHSPFIKETLRDNEKS